MLWRSSVKPHVHIMEGAALTNDTLHESERHVSQDARTTSGRAGLRVDYFDGIPDHGV